MTSKTTVQRRASLRPPPIADDAPQSLRFAGWWLLSTLLVLNRHDRWVTATLPIISPPVDGVLAPAWAWSVPLGRLAEYGLPTEFPVWMFAVSCGVVIAALGRGIAASRGTAAGLLALIGWSAAVEPDDLVPGLFLLTGTTLGRWGTGPRTNSVAAIGYLGLSLISTVEFGFVWLHAGLALAPNLVRGTDNPRRWRLCMSVAITAAGLVAAATWHGGGCATALWRPINWVWLQPDQQLLPSLGSALTNPATRLAQGVLCCSLVMFWWPPGESPAARPSVPWITLLLSALGVACGRYLWLATASLATRPQALAPTPPPSRRERLWLTLGIGLALAFPLANSATVWEEVWGSGAPSGRWDPTAWAIQGPVMLTNLDDSRAWQATRLRSQYRLVLSDRWDVYGQFYSQYAAVCRDIVEVRNDSYLRTDGRWGGYTQPLKDWSPTLFVVDSRRLDDLRELALSPHWKTLGIDGTRTVFGSADDPQLRTPLSQAAATLSRLELPGMSGRPLDPNVVVVERSQDYRQAALVLSALRLPYAGLRVLHADSAAANRDVEAVCYLELAHRSQRYAGTTSLLDQVRGVHRARQLENSSRVDGDLGLVLARSLASLGLPEEAQAVARSAVDHRSLHDFWRGSDTEASQRALDWILNSADSTGLDAANGDSTGAEQEIRRALARGDSDAASSLVAQLDPAIRSYYSVLAGAADAPASQTADRLGQLLEHQEVLLRLLGEAYFYRGCLAVEIGDPPTAVTAFARSAEQEPRSPFAPLRTLYWKQVDQQ